jgi:hypothetical protein
MELHVDHILEYFQKIEQCGVSLLSDSMCNRVHISYVPQDSNDSVDTFSHVVREKEALVDFLECLVPGSVEVCGYDYRDGVERASGYSGSVAETGGDKGSR